MLIDWKAQHSKDANSPQTDTEVQCSSIKTPERLFIAVDKIIVKCICKGKGTRITQTFFKKKNKVVGIHLPNFKIYYMATIMKIVWYCCTNRHIDQWRRTDNTEMDAYKYAQQIF